MKKYGKRYGEILVIIAVMIVSSTVGTSCKKNTDGDIQILSQSSQEPLTTTSVDQPLQQLPEATSEEDLEGDKDYKHALVNTTKLAIYCINDDASEVETVEVIIDQRTKVSSSFVTEKVVDEFSNHDLKIGIDKVTEDEEGNVIVSFKKNCAPEKGVGKNVESLILDCISQSILDDVESSSAVIFQIEGAAYKSSHTTFKLNEAYSWK